MSRIHQRRRRQRGTKARSESAPFPLLASHRGVVIPSEHTCDMQYAFLGTAAASTGYTEAVFSGTNPTDPGLGSDTRQPVGFDEMQAWYTNCRVNKARIEIQASLSSSSATPTATLVGGDLTLYMNESTSALTLQSSAIAQPGAKFARMALGSITRMNMDGDTKTVMGLTHAGNDNFVGTTSGGPSSFNWCFHLGRSCDVAYTGVSIEYTLRIIYNITFFNRKLVELPTFQAAHRKFVLENAKSWIAQGDPSPLIQKTEGKGNDEFKVVERTDGKPVTQVSKQLRPVLPESLSQSVASARDYAWVKLPAPLLKN